MAVLGEIRRRPWLLMGVIALGLLAFLVNADTIDKVFGKNPNIFGKVNGDEITRDEYNDQLMLLQQQAQQQGQSTNGLEEQAWQILVQSKLIKQEFDKLGLTLTDEFFWSQVQNDQLFAQDPNFKAADLKKQVETWQANGDVQMYNNWLRNKKAIEYRMMARQVFANVSTGITTSKKEAEELMRQRDQLATVDYVKVDYTTFGQKNPVKVSTQDLADYIKKHPITFKRDAGRNLGIVYFPAQASAQDEAATLAEMNNLIFKGNAALGTSENFSTTTNDSLFIETNSDVRFMSQYVSVNQLPMGIQNQVASAAIGQVVGPYKEQGYYVASKILGKKPSDSTLSKHILVAYKGAQRSEQTRSKEAAKKMADSLLAAIGGNTAKFNAELKFSDEPGAVERGGSVGWTTPESPFDPAYLKFLASNGKGTIGIAESSFGYHIINIEDKKAGAMTYKVANLVKAIRPSDKTESDVYNKATKFIQQVQGKSFNDFANIAKKSNYNFQNPKNVTRFQGSIPGVGTDKDNDVIVWSFDKKRQKGDTEIFTVDGTGAKIVVMINGIQEKGLADPESVRDQVEPLVKNQLLAKTIKEKVSALNATSLSQVAQSFGSKVETTQMNLLNPVVGGSMEPKVAGAAFGVANNKLSNPVEGYQGVYVVMRKGLTTNKQPGDIKNITQAMTQQNAQTFGQALMKSLQDNADIKDYRNEVINKVQQ